jgi:uncharacterized protein YjiS (DUF1127 family)
MFRRKLGPDLIRAGYRFADKNMRRAWILKACPGSEGTGHASGAAVSCLIESAVALLARARRRMRDQRTRYVLERLSDRTLKDIGIHRSEISSFTASDRDRRRHKAA